MALLDPSPFFYYFSLFIFFVFFPLSFLIFFFLLSTIPTPYTLLLHNLLFLLSFFLFLLNKSHSFFILVDPLNSNLQVSEKSPPSNKKGNFQTNKINPLNSVKSKTFSKAQRPISIHCEVSTKANII